MDDSKSRQEARGTGVMAVKQYEQAEGSAEGSALREREHIEDAMYSNTWNNCPRDLIVRILARLPLSSLIRFRTVSKSWNYLLSSQDFLDEVHRTQQKQKTQQETWFVSGIDRCNKLAIYAPSLKKWTTPTLPLLDMRMHSFFSDVVDISASTSGLVCLTRNRFWHEEKGKRGIDLFIWNPLTNKYRELPRSPAWKPFSLVFRLGGMYVNYATKGYKLITLDKCSGEQRPGNDNDIIQIYDSSTNAWKSCSNFFSHLTVSQLSYDNMYICCDSSVYSIRSEKPYTILAFDMSTEVWREIVAPMSDIKCPNLVELYNKLYMVAQMRRDDSIRIWQLLEHADGRGQWIAGDRLPQELPNKLSTMASKKSLTETYWRCVGSGDFLLFRVWESLELLMYSISGRSWSSLPACVLENDKNLRSPALFQALALSPGWISP